MAHVAPTQTHLRSGFGLFNVFRAIGSALIAIGEANQKVRRVEQMQNMSDQELAELGVKREDIARYVFGTYPF